MRHSIMAGACLLVQVTVVLCRSHTPSQFDYRSHHDEAAAKVMGKTTANNELQGSTMGSLQAPRVKEQSVQVQEEPERWSQYVPEHARSIAAEVSEARRETRQREAAKLRAQERQREEQEEAKRTRVAAGRKKESESVLQKGAQRLKSATKKTQKRAEAKMQHFLHGDDYDEMDEDDDEDDEGHTRRRSSTNGNGMAGQMWGAVRWLFAICYSASSWSSRNLLWTPMTYVAEAVRWSAHTSWKTTRWTGERALVGPALTAGAPLIYLVEGLLFLFVYIPARAMSIVVRELYPVYIYLGAALAVGTGMGIASAVVLYIGSFLLSDTSAMQDHLQSRVEAVPENLHQRFRERKKASPARKWARRGESIIERAMKESLEREERERQLGGARRASQELHTSPVGAESDEEDDYFGNASSSMAYKGKARSSNEATPTGPVRRSAPAHSGPPVPLGATSQGGWSSSRSDSTNSTPAASPTASRNSLPATSSPFPYTAARSHLGQSPLTSPDIARSGSHSQRRGVNASV